MLSECGSATGGPSYHGLGNLGVRDSKGRPYKSMKLISVGQMHKVVSATASTSVPPSPKDAVPDDGVHNRVAAVGSEK
jgi:hypothetical protein